MVSSPSQVDAYWSVLLPPFGNYELEPEKKKESSHPVCLGVSQYSMSQRYIRPDKAPQTPTTWDVVILSLLRIF